MYSNFASNIFFNIMIRFENSFLNGFIFLGSIHMFQHRSIVSGCIIECFLHESFVCLTNPVIFSYSVDFHFRNIIIIRNSYISFDCFLRVLAVSNSLSDGFPTIMRLFEVFCQRMWIYWRNSWRTRGRKTTQLNCQRWGSGHFVYGYCNRTWQSRSHAR